jgi:hypothetical protein
MLRNWFYLLLMTVLLNACAVPGEINGGPRDTEAPKLMKYYPDSLLLNFTGKTIRFGFNERVQLKNLQTQLVINPDMLNPPEILASGNDIVINFKNNLKENTTYVFNFGNAIADLNEGNSISEFNYVFSTGSFIDSLKVSGKVIDAYNNSPLKDIKLLLYEDTGQIDIVKRKPDYFVRSNPNGQYLFQHIKNGQYKILAVEDKNNNNSFDPPDERIGFINEAISIQKLTEIKDIHLFKDEDDFKVKNQNITGFGKLEFQFNRSIESIQLQPEKSKSISLLGPYFNTRRDSVIYYYNDTLADTIRLQRTALSKRNEQLKDTVFLPPIIINQKNNPNTSGKGRGSNAMVLKPELKWQSGIHVNDTIKLVSNSPLKTIQAEAIVLSVGKTVLKSNWRIHKSDPRILESQLTLVGDKEYNLNFDKNAVSTIYNISNDSFKLTMKTQAFNYFGHIKASVKLPDSLSKEAYIIKLIDDKGNLVKWMNSNSQHTYEFSYLNPIDYTMKIEFGKGEWQSGQYKKRRQALAVYNYNLPIKLRSDWTNEVVWEVK